MDTVTLRSLRAHNAHRPFTADDAVNAAAGVGVHDERMTLIRVAAMTLGLASYRLPLDEATLAKAGITVMEA